MPITLNTDHCLPYRNLVRTLIDSVIINPSTTVESPTLSLNQQREAELKKFNASRLFNQSQMCWEIRFESDNDYTLFALKWG